MSPVTPSVNPSIKITKSLPYRGGVKLYSNRYHFNGGTPGTPTAWTTLADAVVLAEKAIHIAPTGGTPQVTIVEATGYAAGSEIAVFTKAYTTLGTLATGGASICPGECAALVKFLTGVLSTRNHPIYAFSYYHGVISNSGTGNDFLVTAQKNAIDTYSTAWITGFSDGTHTCVRATPAGHGCTSRVTSPLITHRDFPK